MTFRQLIQAAALLLTAGAAQANFTTQPVTTAYVGLPYEYRVTANGVGAVEITAPSGLPAWLQLDRIGNGAYRLWGTPAADASSASIVLRSEDLYCRFFNVNCYQHQNFTLTVVANTAPHVVAPGITDQSAVEGTPFQLDVSAAFADADGDTLTLTVAGLPSGFSFSGGVISGTPTTAHAQGSPYTIEVTAADGRGGSVVESFQLTVAALQRADLALASIAPSPSPATPSQAVTWTITIENLGPDTSGEANVTVDVLGNTVTLSAHRCTTEARADGQRLLCRVPAIDANETASVSFATTASAPGDVYVTAAVAGAAAVPIDPFAGNETGAAALNVGTALSAEPAQRVGEPALTAAAADLNGDGYDDLVVATAGNVPAALHLNVDNPSSLHASLLGPNDVRRGLSTLSIALGDGAASTAAVIADFDADGDLDTVVARGAAAGRLFVNDGAGAMTPGIELGAGGTAIRAMAAADIDGDGFPDIVLATAGRNALWLNRGGTKFEAGTLNDSSRASVGVALADLDGDGRPEAVFANADGDATRHRNTGSGFAAPTILPTGRTSAVAAGDLNGDGFIDLVFARVVPGASGVPSNPVYFNDGSGGFTLAGELGASPTVDILVADIDGDTHLDIVSINSTGAHQVFINDGAGGFAQHRTLFVAPGADAAVAARIGLRPGVDVVVLGEQGASVFLNDGSGNLGLGDTGRPVIELIGAPQISLEVEQPYQDPGATVRDDVDGAITPVVDNPVDAKVIGTYTVTYTAVDSAGNAATPVTRTVNVQARTATGGGGGGAADAVLLMLLGMGACVMMRRQVKRSRP